MDSVRKVFALEVLMSAQQQSIDLALQEIGLTQNEIALYRTALSLGPKPASTLAKSIHVQRTRVYDLLSSLEARGLIEMFERNSVRHYAATSPDHLVALVRNRKQYVESQLDLIEKSIPSLFGQVQWSSNSVESRTVRGARLVKEALMECLESSQSSILSIGDVEQLLRTNIGTSRWAQEFRHRRISLGVKLRIAIHGTPDLLEEGSLLRETLSSPDIPKTIVTLASNNLILMVDFSGTIQATRIESKIFCEIFNGLYHSWYGAVHRIS